MVQLPITLTDDQDVMLLQTRWAALLNPTLKNPLLFGRVLKSVQLISGDNVVNHGLGRVLQGWTLVRQRASAAIYDTQDTNVSPSLTLQLNASADVVVDIYVF